MFNQYGFKPGDSCINHIIAVTQDIFLKVLMMG